MSILRATVFLVIIPFTLSYSQERGGHRPVPSEGVYVNVGIANGPEFSDFFDYVNNYYQARFSNTTQKVDYFGKGADFGIGYIVRLYPNFALDVGFSIYRLKSAGRINNNDYPNSPELYIDHDLEYQVGLFSVTIPVLLDFDPRQPIVPYAGLGISIFSMRLDDIRADGYNPGEILRETNTSVGGHFETGLFVKTSKRIWIDFKARWHSGSANLRTLEPAPPEDPGSFKVKQSVAQFTLGAIYYFR